MKILLDTHVALRTILDSKRLSAAMRVAIESTETIVYISLISLWELRIKETIGKLPLPKGFYTSIEPDGYELLSIKPRHIHEYGTLPLLHRDPFDRMLVAQARTEQLTLATADKHIMQYDVPTL